MDTQTILNRLNNPKKSFDLYEKRPGKYQLITPILHEDGDMMDIYLQDSPKGKKYVRINDFGLALQRLSYSYDLNTPSKKKILNNILLNNGVQNDNGNLYLDIPLDKLYESILQFAGCVQKVCSMDYWSREISHSSFYDDLNRFINTKFEAFNPEPDIIPLPDKKKDNNVFKVDWRLRWNTRCFYLFGVRGKDKAKESVISLLEFKRAKLHFISLIVHEDIQNMGNKELIYLTRNADKQYPILNDFNDTGAEDMKRLAG